MLGLCNVADESIRHRLTPDFLAEFYSGPITEKSMAVLRGSVYSQRLAMLIAVREYSSNNSNAAEFQPGLEQSLGILSTLETRAPMVVEDVLMHPSTGVWLVRALRALLGVDHASTRRELRYLHSLAAAAAIRAGFTCTITVAVNHGVVSLPTVGHVPSPSGAAGGFAELHSSPESVLLYFDGSPEPIRLRGEAVSPEFVPAQQHHASALGGELVVEIDDTNPYREFTAPEPPHRLSPAELTRWHNLLDSAWDVLTRQHPAYARELSAGLRTVAPVGSSRNVAGSSSNSAFGGIALSPKTSATTLAEVLVHELQHSKLNALLELVPLRREDSEKWWYAPWRDDPRPLVGLLHGIYAFVSVVEFWWTQRDHVADEAQKREADFIFAYRRHQVRRAVNELASAPELTEVGSGLVAGVADRLARCEAEIIPAELTEAVMVMEKDHWITWRLQNLRPDAEYVGLLAHAWLSGRPAPLPPPAEQVEPFRRRAGSSARVALLKAKTIDPGTFAGRIQDADARPDTTEADIAFAVGDHAAAADRYIGRIRATADDGQAWAGLAVTLEPETSAGISLQAVPEIVRAVYEQLLDLERPGPNPLDLADWLGQAIRGGDQAP